MVSHGAMKITEGYLGEYASKLVAGYRVVVPPLFRRKLGKEFIIAKGYEGALIIVDYHRWDSLIEPLKAASFLDRNLRETLRFLVASAYSVKVDAQGRLVIPQALRTYAEISDKHIGKELVLLGTYNWIELWEKERWVKHKSYIEENADAIAQELSHLKKPD